MCRRSTILPRSPPPPPSAPSSTPHRFILPSRPLLSLSLQVWKAINCAFVVTLPWPSERGSERAGGTGDGYHNVEDEDGETATPEKEEF